jgi:hypothetical protein
MMEIRFVSAAYGLIRHTKHCEMFLIGGPGRPDWPVDPFKPVPISYLSEDMMKLKDMRAVAEKQYPNDLVVLIRFDIAGRLDLSKKEN